MKKTRNTRMIALVLSAILLLPLLPSLGTVEARAAQSVVSRDDGVWLFPLPSNKWNSFSDWAGCNCHYNDGYGNCPFHGVYEYGCGADHYSNSSNLGHNGVDIGASTGTEVYASAAGYVYYSSEQWGARGYTIVMEHSLGNGYSYYSYYQHLSQNNCVTRGSYVSAGTLIGKVGATGGNYGAHLHFGIVMAESGLGNSMSSGSLFNIEAVQWIRTPGYQRGRIVNNPAMDNPVVDGNYSIPLIDGNSDSLRNHCGSVHYTFDSSRVAIGEGGTTTVDVNGALDGELVGNVAGFGTFDMYINGVKMADDATDYYQENVASGTTWEIADIRPAVGKSYNGITEGSRTGTVSGTVNLRLDFSTIPETISEMPVIEKFNGHTYYFFSTPSTWYEAWYLSDKMGGYLVSVSSAEENEFLKGMTGGKGAWICATDQYIEGNWLWMTGETFSYTNWADGEPNNSTAGVDSGENYAHFLVDGSGKWNDANGSEKFAFICEVGYLVGRNETLYPYTIEMIPGSSFQLGNTNDDTIYSTSNSEIASVTSSGKIEAKAVGSAVIASTTQGEVYETQVTVLNGSNTEFGDWNETLPKGVDSERYEIETKEYHRYRDTTEETTYGEWGSNATTETRPAENDTVRIVSTQTYYNYYHYCCNSYNGVDNNVDSIPYGSGPHYYHTIRLTYQLSASNVHDMGGKTFYYCSDPCPKNYNVWAQSDPFETHVYTYQTRTVTESRISGEWSSWQEEMPEDAENREIEHKTVYRYKLKETPAAAYTVTFDANGGVNAPAAQTKTEGASLTLTADRPTREGYAFTGWNTKADGSGTQYASGASYSENANVTLFAQWTETETPIIPVDPTPADPTDPQIKVASVKVVRGKEFTVKVEVLNNPGFMALVLTPVFPEAFTLVKVENGTLIRDMTGSKNYLWTADSDITQDGTLLTLTFATDEDLPAGDYPVQFKLRECKNQAEQAVKLAVSNGIVTVLDVTFGDANDDGEVTTADIIRLKNYLANYDYDTGLSAVEIGPGADANGDGEVTTADIIRLKNYLANFDYDAGTSTVPLGA